MRDLDEPIKFSWTGKARRRIEGANRDFDSEKSDRIVRTLSRLKTRVVIESVEEAAALAGEMADYEGEAGDGGRVWVNGSAAASCKRVREIVVDAMAERGYEPTSRLGRVRSFEVADDDAELDVGISEGDEVEIDLPWMDADRGRVTDVDNGNISVETDEGGSVACSMDDIELTE